MKKFFAFQCFALIMFSFQASANYAEFFGSHPTTSAIGNQANSNQYDPSNNYYIPALMGFSDTITFSSSAGSVSTDFEPVGSVVTKNTTNDGTQTGTSTESAAVRTDYDSFMGATIHATLPLGYPGAGAIAVSILLRQVK